MGNAVQNRDFNTRFQDISGTASLAAAGGDATLVTNPNTAYSIFIQRISVVVTTDAAQSASFEDSNSTPVVAGRVNTSPGLGYKEVADHGPQGLQLTEGKNFVLNVSAAGLGMDIHWEGYMRPTATSRAATSL